MPRRRVISLLSLAGFAFLHGCADSSTPSNPGAQSSSQRPVVFANHFESVPRIDFLLDETSIARPPAAQEGSDRFRRLPPVYPIPVLPMPASPRSGEASPNSLAGEAAPSFKRLPNINHVAAAEAQAYAIDLTVEEEANLTPPPVSLLPSIVKIVTEKEEAVEPVAPKRRFVHTKAPKPPLPPLTRQSAAAPGGSSGWLMTGNALTAVSQRADGMIERGFALAEKGAFYSAKTEFKHALRTVAQALDTHFGTSNHSKALAAGWLALDEANDFSAQSQRGPVVDVALIVDSHQTPLLKEFELEDVSPVLAMQHYFAFAQEQLAEGCGQAPVASRALHGLGKIHMVLGEKSASAERLHGPKAMAFQQAALTTDPGNFLAANEFGVLLARFGKLHEARAILQYSVGFYPLAETWQNLSIVHQRLGEENLAAQSVAHWQAALQSRGDGTLSTRQADNRSTVQWISPQAFANQQPGTSAAPSMPMPVAPPSPPAQAKKKSGFLWW